MEGFINFIKEFANNDYSESTYDISYQKIRCYEEDSFTISTYGDYFVIEIIYEGMEINNVSCLTDLPPYLADYMVDNTISEEKTDHMNLLVITKHKLSMHPFYSRTKSARK